MSAGWNLDEPKLTANTAQASHWIVRYFLSAVLFLAATASMAGNLENIKVTWGPIEEDSHYQSLTHGFNSDAPGCPLVFAVYKVYYEFGPEGYADVTSTNPAFDVPCTIYRRRADGVDGDFKPVGRIVSGYIWNHFIDYDVVPGVEYTYYVSIDRDYVSIHGDSLNQIAPLETPHRNFPAAYTYRAEISENVVSFDASYGEHEVDVAIYQVTSSGSSKVIWPDIRTTLLKGDYITWKHEDGDGISTYIDHYNPAIGVNENDTGKPREWLVYVGFVGCDDPFIPLECGSIMVKQAAKEDAVSVDVGTGAAISIPKAWLSEKCAAALEANGDDFKAAALGTAANGRKVWECYVLGLDPTVKSDDFRIVSFALKADGTPDISGVRFEPAETMWNLSGAKAVLKGAPSLEGEWRDVSYMSEGEQAEMRFFRVDVLLP